MAETDVGTDLGIPTGYLDYAAAARAAGAQPVAATDFIRNQQLTELSASLYAAYNQQYNDATGQNLPSSQRSIVMAQLMKMDPEVFGHLYQVWQATQGRGNVFTNYLDMSAYRRTTGKAANAMLTKAEANALKDFGQMTGFLDTAMYSATGGTIGSTTGGRAAAPSLSPQQAALEKQKYDLASEYLKTTGKSASDAQINQMIGMSQAQRDQFFMDQPYRNGLTLGQWQTSQSRVNKLYQSYFGRDANDQEITWANGKSDDDVMHHINESPSKISGLNVGQYSTYRQVLDKISQDQYGRPADDTIVKGFHDLLHMQ